MLQKSIAEDDGLIGTSVCASTKASRYAVYTKARVDLVGNDFASSCDLSFQSRRFVKDNCSVMPGSRSNSWNGEILSVDENWLAIPSNIQR